MVCFSLLLINIIEFTDYSSMYLLLSSLSNLMNRVNPIKLLMLKKIKYQKFFLFWLRGWDITLFSFSVNNVWAKIEKTKGTLFSQTLIVEENKVHFSFSILGWRRPLSLFKDGTLLTWLSANENKTQKLKEKKLLAFYFNLF